MREKIKVKVNGEEQQAEGKQSLTELLQALQLIPEQVVVEYNGEALSQHEFHNIQLQEGDQLEVINIVAGG